MTPHGSRMAALRWPRVLLSLSGLALLGGFVAHSSCAARRDAPAQDPENPAQAPPTSPPDTVTTPQSRTVGDAGISPAKVRRAAMPSSASPASGLPALPSRPVLQLPPAGIVGSTTDPNIPHVDPLALPLFSDIERELHRDPPPEAHALVGEFRRGADRGALIDFVRQRFPRDLALRAVALRWIDRVRPARDGAANSPAPGSGGAAPWVAPIGKR